MKISSSAVSMSASREYSLISQSTSAVVTIAAGSQAGLLDTSDNTKDSRNTNDKLSLSDQAKNLSKQLQQQRREEALAKKAEEAKETEATQTVSFDSEDEMILETLRKILEILRTMKKGGNKGMTESIYQDLKSTQMNQMQAAGRKNTLFSLGGAGPVGGMSGATLWTRQSYSSNFVSEKEATTFSSTGVAKTEDGREISFQVDLSMSREFMEKSEVFTEQTGYFFTDPLVVNLSGNAATLSDQKFLFDLDADGEEEEISNLNAGSGFLALDKNEDGVINDGNELFGAKSGDGFADLSVYDQDKNGWIDENDSVWNELKIWTKNEDGTDRLISLKDAGVGALFTGKADTQFSLNNSRNETNGVIRSTGVFLMENGAAGTLQHVDLAV